MRNFDLADGTESRKTSGMKGINIGAEYGEGIVRVGTLSAGRHPR
jgi:hypothetical protein